MPAESPLKFSFKLKHEEFSDFPVGGCPGGSTPNQRQKRIQISSSSG